jgi:hypothetical protein
LKALIYQPQPGNPKDEKVREPQSSFPRIENSGSIYKNHLSEKFAEAQEADIIAAEKQLNIKINISIFAIEKKKEGAKDDTLAFNPAVYFSLILLFTG